MLSEYITSLADVSFHIVASMYVRFRNSRKNQMRFVVFGVFLCGFAVFGPPLCPPLLAAVIIPIMYFYTTQNVVNKKKRSVLTAALY